MKKIVVAAVVVVLGAGAVLAARGGQEGGMPQPPKPLKEHDWLKAFEGVWEFSASFTMAPGQPPMKSKGMQVDRMANGGLWLIIDSVEDKKDAPFHGHGMVGYDPEKKKYISVWVDNHTTKFETAEGTADAEAKSLTMESEMPGPDGKPRKIKQVSTITGKDTKTLKFFGSGADGKEVLFGEIEYVRKK